LIECSAGGDIVRLGKSGRGNDCAAAGGGTEVAAGFPSAVADGAKQNGATSPATLKASIANWERSAGFQPAAANEAGRMPALLFLRLEKLMTRSRYHSDLLIGSFEGFLHLLDELIDAKARWSLTGRIVFKGGKEFGDDRLGGEERPGRI